MASEKVPEKIAWHDFNKSPSSAHASRPAPAQLAEVDIIHSAAALFSLGLLDYDTVLQFATRLHTTMQGKTFTHGGQSYKVVKVFHAGNGVVKMRCEVVTLQQSEQTEMEAC